MKKARNNQELAHLWASMNVEGSRAGNFWFAGSKLYSYNTQIAQIMRTVAGQTIALIIQQNFSSTTVEHKGLAARAVSFPFFHSKYLSLDDKQLLTGAQETILEILRELPVKFKPDSNKTAIAINQLNHQLDFRAAIDSNFGGEYLGHAYFTPENLAERRDQLLGQAKQMTAHAKYILHREVLARGLQSVNDGLVVDSLGYLSSIKALEESTKALIETGLTAPTGNHTLLKKAKAAINLVLEREFANDISEQSQEFIKRVTFLKSMHSEGINANALQAITAYFEVTQKLQFDFNELLKKEVRQAGALPIVKPLSCALDYLTQEAREFYARFTKKIEDNKAALIEQWRTNSLPISALRDIKDIHLRVVGQRIETSHSAIVPLKIAKNVWRLVKLATSKGENIEFDKDQNHLQLGAYDLNTIFANGDIKVGCHLIRFNELELMAKKLGFES